MPDNFIDDGGAPDAGAIAVPERRRARGEIIFHAALPLALYRVADAAWTVNRGFADALELSLDPGKSYPGDIAWGHGWPKVEPLIARILNGDDDHALYDRLVETKVNGRPHRRCWTFAFSPVRENESIVAVLALSAETTRQLHAEARLTFLLDLSERLRASETTREAMAIVGDTLSKRFGAAGALFEIYADNSDDGMVVAWPDGAAWRTAVAATGTIRALAKAHHIIEIADVADASAGVPQLRAALRAHDISSMLIVPLVREGALVATLAVVDERPRYWSDDERDLASDSLIRAWDSIKRLRAEAVARAAQERFELLEQGNDVGIFDRDIVTGRYSWSEGVYRILGVARGAIEPGRDAFTHRLHSDDAGALHQAVDAALASHADTFLAEYRLWRDDGTMRWLQCDARIFRDANGVALRMTGILRDITARKLREDADAAETRRQQFLAALDEQFRVPVDTLDVLQASANALIGYLDARAVGFVAIDAATAQIVSLRALVGDTAGQRLLPLKLRAFGVAAQRKLLTAGAAATLPRGRPRRSIGDAAVLLAPVLRGRVVVGGLWIEAPSERDWTASDLAVAEMVASRTAAAIEHARAELALKDNERLLRAIGEASVDPIYAKDADGRWLYANPATSAVFDMTSAAMIGANDRQVIESGQVHRFEEVATMPDGESRLFLSTKSPMRDTDGRVVGFAGVSTDITELRAAEALLRDSEARFRTLAEQIPILCWMADPSGEAFWYNSRWYDYTGLTPEASRGGGWRDAHDPQFVAEINARWDAARRTGALFEMLFPLRGRDGSYQPFLTRVAPIRDEAGKLVRWFGTHTNVSEVEALRRTEALHELVLESAADFAIVTMNDAGVVVSWNRGAEHVFGWTSAEMIGASIDRVMEDPAKARTEPSAAEASAPDRRENASLASMLVDAVASGRRESNGERWRRDGRKIWVTGVLMPLRDPDGRHRGFLEISRDTTDQRRQEEHRLLLVAELNHRVKNTLAIVQGIAQQSFRSDSDAIEARRLFEGRLGTLASAHNLLTRESWEAADIVDIVADAIQPYDARGVRFTVGGPSVRLEPQLSVTMAMALNELCTNARKYGALSNERGHVDITWTFDAGALDLVWRERGGPPVGAPLRRGFGTRLIERAMAGYPGGAARIFYHRDGLTCRFQVRIAAEPAP